MIFRLFTKTNEGGYISNGIKIVTLDYILQKAFADIRFLALFCFKEKIF